MCDGEYYEGECEECGEITQVIDNEIHGIRVCDGCFDTDFSRCELCDATYRHENMGIYCEVCEEELTCKDCGVCDEYVMGGKCDDCLKKYLDENERKMLKIVEEHKELRERVVRKLLKHIEKTLGFAPEKKQKKYKLKIVGVYQQ